MDPSSVGSQTTSPRDQDEEYEGEGEFLPVTGDFTPSDTKYWKVQAVGGPSKPKWRNCHSAVLQNDSRMIVRSYFNPYFAPCSLIQALTYLN